MDIEKIKMEVSSLAECLESSLNELVGIQELSNLDDKDSTETALETAKMAMDRLIDLAEVFTGTKELIEEALKSLKVG